MWNTPTKEKLSNIPELYSTDGIKDKTIYAHFFVADCDWYIAEYDGDDLFFGYSIINGDYMMAEWGYISFKELKSVSISGVFEVEFDDYWVECPASQVKKMNM